MIHDILAYGLKCLTLGAIIGTAYYFATVYPYVTLLGG